MTRPPLILISPNIEKKGDEFGDLSISLSETYQQALMGCGAIPAGLAGHRLAGVDCRMRGALRRGFADRRRRRGPAPVREGAAAAVARHGDA